MIRSLSGSITHATADQIVVEVRGVGYLVHCANLTGTLSVGDSVTLHTYLAVRETALDLYGFKTESEHTMFALLLNIPKIGPKSALSILTSATPKLLSEAAEKNDPKYLQKLSGLGKKTCENVVAYLKDKLDHLPDTPAEWQTDLNQVQIDAIDALVALGYDIGNARETIKHIYESDTTVNALVTKALKQM